MGLVSDVITMSEFTAVGTVKALLQLWLTPVLVCFLHACLCLPAVRGVTNKPVSLVFKLNPHFKACSHTLSLYGSPSDSFKSTPLVFSLSVLWCFVVRLSFLSDQTAPRLCCVSPWSSRGLKIRQLYHICHSDHHHAVMSCSVVQ